jgi:DNA-binding beta-propeller fold protein YncE
MKTLKRLIFLLLATLVAQSPRAQEKLIVLNEGNWQSNNGRISYFNNGSIVSNKWFEENNGYGIGDTPNDIIQINSNLIAIAVNWSNIIQYITPEGKAVAATEDVPNNRKLCSDGRYLYVSSYGHECKTVDGYVYFTKGYVAKIDVTNFTVVATCEVGYEPEGIAIYDGHLFVANSGGYAFQEDHEYEHTVSIIDASTMKLVRDVDVHQINLYGKMSQSGQYLCINSPGDYYEIPACTIIFDCKRALAGADDCFVTLEYASTYNCVARDGTFLAIGSRYSYLTNEYTFNYITIDPVKVMADGPAGVSESLPGTMLSDIQKMTMPYGIYVNPYTGYIYGTDAGGFVSAGSLYQWDPSGKLLGKHKVYINPAHFLALPPNGVFQGIDAVRTDASTTDADGALYNLQGIRVSNPQRGEIYICNRKKLIWK